MIDISKQSVKIVCPECKQSISVTIKQVADEVLVKCTFGLEIQLQDSNGTKKQSRKYTNHSKTLNIHLKN